MFAQKKFKTKVLFQDQYSSYVTSILIKS